MGPGLGDDRLIARDQIDVHFVESSIAVAFLKIYTQLSIYISKRSTRFSIANEDTLPSETSRLLKCFSFC